MSEENKNINDPSENAAEDAAESRVEDVKMESCLFESDESAGESLMQRQPRRVSLTTFVCSLVALCLAAVMITYTVTAGIWQQRLADARLDNVQTGVSVSAGNFDELELLQRIFEAYSFRELDETTITTQLLKAYVYATGDRYAEYFTNEEYAEYQAELAGDNQGIGINVIETTVIVGGQEYKAMKVINVMPDSPAQGAGVLIGDYIVAVGTAEEHTTFNALGYAAGLAALRGVKGTLAEFIVYREKSGTFETVPFSILRDEFKTAYVMSKLINDPVDGSKIGVVKIIQFYLDTPTQVSHAVDTLKAQGCEKFVFDLRYNPGGDLDSIVAVLSYFLEEGDTVISTKNNKGEGETITVGVVDEHEGARAACNVSSEDIGKYKDLDMVVMCNGSTASAAELFTANFIDHELGVVVGETTFGKGSMQSHISLSYFGYDGVLKLTTNMYYPPNGTSYEGVGITPDITVEISEEAKGINIYDIFGDLQKDNQLAEAIKHFKTK